MEKMISSQRFTISWVYSSEVQIPVDNETPLCTGNTAPSPFFFSWLSSFSSTCKPKSQRRAIHILGGKINQNDHNNLPRAIAC